MDGFKNSTKTHYAKGGSTGTKGAAKIAKVMGEFKAGTLHSGSKKGPEVTNRKQATAIALSEARKAGAKIPVKRAKGTPMGMGPESVSSRPKDSKGRPISMEELSTPERIMAKSGRADPYEKMPKNGPKAKPRTLAVERVSVTEEGPRTALDRKLSTLPSQRGETRPAQRGKGSFRSIPLVGAAMDALGLKKGGLAAMPRGKK